ncbi:response regulator [Iningainema tapete]|uniref:response regulator n=1 Tax=Iningainema tapete TaxID=2806730 RepID=UPI001EE32165|nr:response regulator [Iningainema tapete]
MNVLFVEDESRIANFVLTGLKEQGFVVDYCDNGNDGYIRAMDQEYDAIILDIMIPGKDGLSILKHLRRSGRNVPIILLTARNELDDRLEGLNLGADDYIAKPFYVEELVARIHAVVRRSTGDRDLLTQILQNLLSNAIKYNLPAGGIKIRAYLQETTVLISISNSSQDIPTNERERIFDRFYRGDPSRTRKVDGVGLGLSLAREIARFHGGDLTLNPTPSGWTTFTLSLPISAPTNNQAN